ncbi:aminotransferase class I/II-fold pyridoxal phosphate-dependent enzyme [Alkalibaculum sp. M08DMB]|uniref:Aminotransferase class I/II-fold pyridoxal phosphate-dependent enzyme n=1 Tax=Alkalibaculum sporogenes TaxID=2655001 RepID=A0A6A7KC52_9FIRM|nr:DegT/DnrJ/EryC1/StrS family aminotransferase [Alkalibaculum sporogenes]MPW26976.1 aminotransferase class I/II-fold pyridoxal phosphate-dependent enzyme [Alkalibaculum sporogenes]
MEIPLINLKEQYKTIKEECDKKVIDILSSANYIMGDNVKKFEKEFSDFVKVKNSVSVGNGTDALIIVLKALGIGEGDEVITTPFTFFSTAESISFVGATPIFVDVDKDTFNIDSSKIEEKITSKTKAIMPVHIFGQACDMDEINRIAKKNNLKVIEDACQAVGAKYKGRNAGALGDIACFSFFPTKNLGCAGDGGMIVTNDDDLATICRGIRTHGSGENGQKAYNIINNIINNEVQLDESKDNTIYNPLKYFNYLIGHNSRLDEVQAAILRVKLPLLDDWNRKRRDNAQYYSKGLSSTGLITPIEKDGMTHVYHMYILQSEKREQLVEYLKENGIATGIYYPVPIHLQKAYKELGYLEGSFPIAEYLSKRTFAIPMFAELKTEEKEYIITIIERFGKTYE